MKKLFGFLLFLVVIALAAWGGATWFIAQETEKLLTRYSESNKEQGQAAGNFELLDYKSKTFLDSQATIKLSTGILFIDDILADANVLADIKHGPVILTSTGVEITASKWNFHLDLASLDEETMAYVSEVFGDKNPMQGEATVDFEGNVRYVITVPALSQGGTASFDIDGLTLSGTQSSKQRTGLATLNVGEMHMKDQGFEIIVPKLVADLDIQGFIGSQMLGTSKVVASDIKVKPVTGGEISLNIDATTDSQQQGDELSGEVIIAASNIVEPSGTVTQIDYRVNYDGFSVVGLNELSNIETEVNNLKSQLMWNMDATKTPEGQEKMMALVEKMDQAGQQMIKVFFEKVLIAAKSQMTQTLEATGSKGKSTADAEFIYTGSDDDKLLDVDKLMLGDLTGLLKVVAGTIAINIEKNMLTEDLSGLLALATLQGIVKDTEYSYSLNTSLTDGEMTLNGETMSFEEFIAKLSPELPQGDEETLQLPADIAQRIQEEGLNEEIIQAMEESDDINPLVLEQMKEYYRVMNSTDAEPAALPDEVVTE